MSYALNPVYQDTPELKHFKDSVVAEIYLEDDHSVKKLVEFTYCEPESNYVNVTITNIDKDFTPHLSMPSDLRYDVIMAIGDHLNKKINEISWT